jgi:fumarylacetoacetase
MKSWVEYSSNCDFSIYNIPFGIAINQSGEHVAATAIGECWVDLNLLEQKGLLANCGLPAGIFKTQFLNDFIGLGKSVTNAVRSELQHIFEAAYSKQAEVRSCMFPIQEAKMAMPVKVHNYTDFYSSIDHATNVGTMFRDPANALLPNWKHIPIGYHGRASSITVSGTNFHRPSGQTKAADATLPSFGPSKMIDFELEMAFILGKETQLGETIPTSKTNEYIFGFVVFNDWSARDFQTWEYVPLGPFLAKNFCSTISPWIVTLEALEPFRLQGVDQDPEPLPYLKYEGKQNIDIHLEVAIQTEQAVETIVSKSNYKHMYWNMSQQLAHHASNGCNMQVGDMYASGTISGPTPDSYGSMLEIAWKGTKPVKMNDGTERKFILDNDTVIMRAYAEKDGVRVGFGASVAKVLPAK